MDTRVWKKYHFFYKISHYIFYILHIFFQNLSTGIEFVICGSQFCVSVTRMLWNKSIATKVYNIAATSYHKFKISVGIILIRVCLAALSFRAEYPESCGCSQEIPVQKTAGLTKPD